MNVVHTRGAVVILRGMWSVLFLTLLLAAAAWVPGPAAAQAPSEASANLVLLDPTGDPGPLGVGVADNPAMAAYQHIDLTRVEIGNDDHAAFQIILTFAGFDPVATTPAQAASLTDLYCAIQWTYQHPEEDIRYYYDLSFAEDLWRTPGTPPQEPRPDFWFYYRDDDRRESRSQTWYDAGATLTVDADAATITATVGKAFVPVWPGGAAPAVGDALILQRVYCRTDVALFGSMSDTVLPPEGSRYMFRDPGEGRTIQARYADALDATEADPFDWEPPERTQTLPVSGVAPGVSSVIPLRITNHASAKKLVLLEPSLRVTPPSPWNLTITPSIFLAAGETRTVNLVVTPPPDAPQGSEHEVLVTARATGEEHLGVAARIARVIPVLDHAHNTLYLHTRPRPMDTLLDQAYYTAIPAYDLAVSPLQALPDHDNAPAPIAVLTNWADGHALDPLVRPIRFDPEGTVRITIAMEGDASRTARFQMWLDAEETGTIFMVDERIPGDGVTEIEAPLLAERFELPVGAEAYFWFRIGPADVGPSSLADMALDPANSRIQLPIVRDVQDTVLTDGRFVPTIRLDSGEDATAYLNPGMTYTYELLLANEGIETDDLTVRVNATDAAGWRVQVLPGDTFRVTAGNSTPVALSITAPKDAQEGDHPRFELTAQSKHDAAVHTRLQLDAIVTKGVTLLEKRYEEKEGQLAPLAEEAEDTPMIDVLPLLVVMAGLVIAARRRR